MSRIVSLPIGLVCASIGMLLLANASAQAAPRLMSVGAISSQQSSGAAGANTATSQTTTAATSATSQAAQTAAITQHAQGVMLQSVHALQVMQATQSTHNNLIIPGAQSVPDGLTAGTAGTAGGLVPGISGVDPADPSQSATSVPITVNANGSASFTIAPNTAVTLPTTISGSQQITVSGSGSVGTVTTGGAITTLTGGVATSIAPGSTISLPNGGVVTVAGNSASAVPTSLATYTLPASWFGIGGLSQSAYAAPTSQSTGQTTVTVTQTAQQALLTWQSFNIGSHTILDFDQSAGGANVGQWVAINKVANNIAPSQVLGAIQAPGQVYVINQNGIIFGGTSQVNVGALVAASLPINDNLAGYYDPVTQQYVAGLGLLNNPDLQFLFSQLNISAASQGTMPAFTPAAAPTSGTVLTQDSNGNPQMVAAPAAGQDGDVVVQPGAQLTSPTTPEHVGGKIALIGPNVNNAGTISTPDGQTILAAGLQVGLVAHPQGDPSLRGLDVSIGKVSDPSYDGGASAAGAVVNSGLIEIPRADAMLAGMTVNQNGVIDGSTSVALNGRIDLLADYNAVPLVPGENGFSGTVDNFFPTASGVVTLGPNSLTQILPELSSTDTITGSQLALSSLVNIQGQAIHLATNALLLVPSAGSGADLASKTDLGVDAVPLTAGVTLNAGNWLLQQSGSYALTYTSGQVYLDSGATIDVSGSQDQNGSASVIEDIVSEQLLSGATIDVSAAENENIGGASVAEDIISVQLLGSELENEPLQQNGALRGQTIEVDIRDIGSYDGNEWVGTPLADTTGYINLIQRPVGELTTAGGTVAIDAGGSTVMQPTATVNVSGGWINYQGATVETTKLMANGQIMDISKATPNLVYSGVYTGLTSSSTKWNVSQTYSNALLTDAQYDPGYIQGGNGGSLSISTPAMALDGNLYGNTVAGPYQRTPVSQLNTAFADTSNVANNVAPTMVDILGVPNSSALNITFQAQNPATAPSFADYSPTPPEVVFQNGPTSQTPADPFALDSSGNPLPLRSDRVAEVDLSSDLVNSDGFGNLSINDSDGGPSNVVSSMGSIIIPAGVSLTTPPGGSVTPKGAILPGGSITLAGANIDIEGNLAAPGGSLSFAVSDISPYLQNLTVTPASDPTRGKFTLGASATLSTAGLVVDDLSTASAPKSLPLVTSGGSVTISGYNVDLEPGSQARTAIDVSGGAAISATGAITYGNGGSIDIEAGQDTGWPAILGGQLIWNPNLTQLAGYSGNKGASLTIKAPLIQIGGSTLQNGDTDGNTLWLNQTDSDGNLLQPDFFDQGGFAGFTLKGIGENISGQNLPAILIAPNTQIDPEAQSFVASIDSTGVVLAPTMLPQALRAPVSLGFSAGGVKDSILGTLLVRGDFVMDTGAVIQTDPKGGVSVNAQTVTVLGSIIAPGGAISITGGSNSTFIFSSSIALPTIDLGPNSLLSTAGTVELTPNAYGYVTGSVLPGGSITVDGNIVAEAGAVLNVSGASGVLDVPPGEAGVTATNLISSTALVPLRIDSNGGSITLTGEQELFTDATLLGSAGAPSAGIPSMAQGGSLTISSGIYLSSTVPTPLDPNLVITQSALTIPTPSYYPAGQTAIGNAVVDANGNVLAQNGYFAADRFNSGGFGSLTLAGTVKFSGDVNLSATQSLTVAQGGVIFADSTVNLTAPYVDLGMPFQTPLSAEQQQTFNYVFQAGGAADYFSPTYGTGALNVTASAGLIDIGYLSLQNIGNVSLNAANGDIRGDGTLDVAGAISLTAGQIYPTTENNFTIAAYDYNGVSGNGSVTITASGTRQLPLSAGGELNVYASTITQGGVLVAPMGTINLGSGVTGSTPVDLMTGNGVPGQTPTEAIPATQTLTLLPGSITSVSAVDPTTGQALVIPYGTNSNGVSWIDPAGNDITVAGNGPNAIPSKSINISAVNVADQAGAAINISGGGDLYAYQFVPGLGGTNDILVSATSSFAVIPNYQAAYAPYYSSSDYFNGKLMVGDQVYLNASNGLPAGVYTLLPARYALLPGAFLVTPESGIPAISTAVQPDGSSLVSGYLFNGSNPAQVGQPLLSSFQVAPQSVVKTRAEYDNFSANTFLSQSAQSQNVSVPRLPMDAGQLVLAATSTLTIQGSVNSGAQDGGLGGQVDIATPDNILITGPNTNVSADESGLAGATLVLDSSDLSAFGADSLLIGGFSQTLISGTTATVVVTVTTNDLIVDNKGASVAINGQTLNGLSAPDITLVSNGLLQVYPDSIIQTSSTSVTAQPLAIVNGNSNLVTVAASSTSSPAVTLVSSILPSGFAVGSQFMGSTVLSINGTTVTLAADANATVSNTTEAFSSDGNSNLVSVASSNTSSPTVTLASAVLPANFAVGSVLLGSTVLSINGATVTLAAMANATVSNMAEAFSSGAGGNSVTVASSSSSSPTVTLASSTLPAGFGIGSQLLGSTVLGISGNTVTLAANADATVSNANTAEAFSSSGFLVPVASSSAGSPTVTLASSTLPPYFAVGSVLLGSTVKNINGDTVTLTADANATVTNETEAFSSSDGTLLRVSNDPTAVISRPYGINAADTNPQLTIEAGAAITGFNSGIAGGLTLDSTYATSLDPTATLSATAVNLNSGQISIELTTPSIAPTTVGLVLSGDALSNLQATTQTLSLLSYSSIDIYGSGQIGAPAASGQYPVASLALHTAEIRGFSDSGGGGDVTINAQDVSLDNSPNGTAPGAVTGSSGSLTINAATIDLGANQLSIDQYSSLTMNASTGVMLEGETKITQSDGTVVHVTGGLTASKILTLNTPLITASFFSTTQVAPVETITATGGDLVLNDPGTSTFSGTEGLGATLTLVGRNVTANSEIALPSGNLTLHATAGDVSIGGTLNVDGTAQPFNNVTQYTSGGQITLTSDIGSVNVTTGGTVDVSANPAGGNAGTLTVSAPEGAFNLTGTVLGQAGTGGQGGTFSLDAGSVPGGSLQPLDSALDTGGFTQSISIHDRTDTSISVDGTVRAATYNLSLDQGSITVNGTIDASNVASTDSLGNPTLIGGTIDLEATGSVILAPTAILTVAAQNFDNAGQGGSITLSAGAETNGSFSTSALVDIQAGSTIDLSVAANTGVASAEAGDVTGTLHLRAPQTAGNTDLQVNPINGTIVGASSIVVEGYQIFNASADGSIDNQEANVYANGQTFTGNTSNILTRLYASNPNAATLAGLTLIEPGAEIINTTGDLTLANTWDLSTFRFGPAVDPNVVGSGVPGILTLRAAGNLIFNFGASLSDGFDQSNTTFDTSDNPLWTAPLLPAGDQSWSYQLVAGADFNAANVNQVWSSTALQTSGLGGSVLLGQGATALPASLSSGDRGAVIADMGYYQTIRTGTGNITINAGADVQLLNSLATIYTAGTQVPSTYTPGAQVPSAYARLGGLQLPDGSWFILPTFGTYTSNELYGAQFSLEGGNVSISAQGNIAHLTASGQPDSSLELPTTWLYREGALNNGQWLTGTRRSPQLESTSWWVDFSNFFEGVGALGGGNVTLIAGGSVNNVDAVVPTNARLPGLDANGNPMTPNAASLVELGGGNLVVRAGDNINGGVYYVERGQGTLIAGNQILTNSTRATVSTKQTSNDPTTWMPTTLFLGQGSFNVAAGSDLLLGPVANPFLQPQGINNASVNESYFSTYAASDAVDVSSLTGAVTLKDFADSDSSGSLAGWYQNLYLNSANSIANSAQPWLLSTEPSFSNLDTVGAIMPPTLNATAFSSDINVVGSLILSPSAQGTINLVAAGSLNGFQVNQVDLSNGVQDWGSSVINLSDANPANIPGIVSPLSNGSSNLGGVKSLFAESGATADLVLQTKQALHADSNGQPLHANDPNPVILDAQSGDISGFTLFSGKEAQVVAGQDITDIALYIQNVNIADISVVAAGRNIIAYDPNSTLRTLAALPGNLDIASGSDAPVTGSGAPEAGDIQISGPGTLEVLAGQNLNLGIGPENSNGTGVGIASIGDIRNPALPFGGADIIAGAGLGISNGLNNSSMDFTGFIADFLDPATAGDEATRYLPDLPEVALPGFATATTLTPYLQNLSVLMGLPSGDPPSQVVASFEQLSTTQQTDLAWTAFSQLSAQQQDTLALNIFYDVLRDAGRDHNDPSSPGAGNYDAGMAAIQALFPGASSGDAWPGQGDISLTSREIKTTNGGNIDLLAPGGLLNVGLNNSGAPPQDQGILTVDGGNISIFTNGSVNVGTSRIFTLHGGNEIIWSTTGDIAAGNASKTVQSAPPTSVVVDPQSGDVQTDLSGLATGGGIGVLETVVGAPPADVDLIAPNGTINAGDAGIRASGNLNIAAVQVLNAGNISVGGKSTGTPTVTTPNIAGLSAASNTSGAASNAADQAARQAAAQAAGQQDQELPSIITVEILGYGGGDDNQG